MSDRLKYFLVVLHFIGACILVVAFILGEGSVGDGVSGFAGFWALAGTVLLIVISAGAGDMLGFWAGLIMLGLSIFASVTGNNDLWFVLAVVDALLIGLEMYTTGKKPGDNIGEMLVIYLTTFSILGSSLVAGG